MTTRKEHLAWCKQRALEYVDRGDLTGALTSFISDMKKHPDTETHPAISMIGLLLLGGHLDTQDRVREHIEGYN